MLLLEEHAIVIHPPVVAPMAQSRAGAYSIPTTAEHFPPPYSDKPSDEQDREPGFGASLPPPYARTSPQNLETSQQSSEAQKEQDHQVH